MFCKRLGVKSSFLVLCDCSMKNWRAKAEGWRWRRRHFRSFVHLFCQISPVWSLLLFCFVLCRVYRIESFYRFSENMISEATSMACCCAVPLARCFQHQMWWKCWRSYWSAQVQQHLNTNVQYFQSPLFPYIASTDKQSDPVKLLVILWFHYTKEKCYSPQWSSTEQMWGTIRKRKQQHECTNKVCFP